MKKTNGLASGGCRAGLHAHFCGGQAEVVPHKFYSAFEKDWKIESYGAEK